MTRSVRHLNDGWRFRLSADPRLRAPGFDDASLAVVDLPHTLVEVPHSRVDSRTYQVVGTYRRHLDIAPLTEGRRAVLHVEGALTDADVYLDGARVGGHVGGWTPFSVDLTDHLDPSGRGLLALVVDGTERDDVPPCGARWTSSATADATERSAWRSCPPSTSRRRRPWP